jgi:hypothetical protein
MRELSHSARDWLRRIRRAGRQFFRAASAATKEYRIRYELTACMKFKNAAQFLPEWLEFHQIVGFEHFICTTITAPTITLKHLLRIAMREASRCTNGLKRQPFQKLISTVLHIIDTKPAG